jgi:integrase
MKKRITVTIESRANYLRLRWNDGKRRSLALGLIDSIPSRAIATQTKRAIESDWVKGCYDPSLFLYKPQVTGHNAIDISTTELFARFTKHRIKIGRITPHSASGNYHAAERILARKLNKSIGQVDRQSAEALADFLNQTLKPQVGRQAVQLYRACWEFAKGQYLVPAENPWDGLTERFRGSSPKPVEPFSREEVSRILEGFKTHKPHYADFVAFLFGTGCRIGEAVAIKWSSVDADRIWIGESITKKFHNDSTKTGRGRTVLLSPSMAARLADRRERLNPSPDDLVFPTEKGKPIDCGNHRYWWESVLSKINVKYRKPYATRHTAISHALEAGAKPVDVAAQTGHSLDTLLRVYVHDIDKKMVFVEF